MRQETREMLVGLKDIAMNTSRDWPWLVFYALCITALLTVTYFLAD